MLELELELEQVQELEQVLAQELVLVLQQLLELVPGQALEQVLEQVLELVPGQVLEGIGPEVMLGPVLEQGLALGQVLFQGLEALMWVLVSALEVSLVWETQFVGVVKKNVRS